MSLFRFRPRQAHLVWVDSQGVTAKGVTRLLETPLAEDTWAQALLALPQGPTAWIVDDLMAPAFILRDIVEVPSASDARENYFRWRYSQTLGAEGPQSVQALSLGEASWLVAGLPTATLEGWTALAAKHGRPVFSMTPRWLWLYNRLAPTREKPGLLLSLARHPEGGYTGTLAAWGRTLSLVRQWADPLDLAGWVRERLSPTVAFLQREGRTPMECLLWGAPDLPGAELPVRPLAMDLPQTEAL